ncbi:MAG: hypothetical protein GY810_15370 [Aureispira sp.]|nr:hypothetical protein [Aureispira sp.]
MATAQASKKELEQLKSLLIKGLKLYKAQPDLVKDAKEAKRQKWMAVRYKLVRTALENIDGQPSTKDDKGIVFDKEVNDIVAEYKVVRAQLKKNLEDFESDENDVKLVADMIKRVNQAEDLYLELSDVDKEKYQNRKQQLQSTLRFLDKRLKEVKKHLKVVDEAKANAPKTADEARQQMMDLEAELKAIRASLSAN